MPIFFVSDLTFSIFNSFQRQRQYFVTNLVVKGFNNIINKTLHIFIYDAHHQKIIRGKHGILLATYTALCAIQSSNIIDVTFSYTFTTLICQGLCDPEIGRAIKVNTKKIDRDDIMADE